MTKLRYVGPHPEVELSSTGDSSRMDYRVEQGEVIDIAEPALVASLLEQPSNWELEKPAPPAPPALVGPPVTNAAAPAAEESK